MIHVKCTYCDYSVPVSTEEVIRELGSICPKCDHLIVLRDPEQVTECDGRTRLGLSRDWTKDKS